VLDAHRARSAPPAATGKRRAAKVS
jgi:hypothetical protein